MKKIFLFISVCATILLFNQCEQKIASNAYVLQGQLGIKGPLRVYLRTNVGETVDSLLVKDNTFKFKGEVTKPFQATLVVSYDTAAEFSRTLNDRIALFIEPGKIILKSDDSIKHAVINSPINDDAREWKARTKDLADARNKLYAEWNVISRNKDLSPDEISVWTKEFFSPKNDSISSLEKELAVEFIKADPDSYYALNNLFTTVVGYSPDGDEAQQIFDLFSEKLDTTELGKAIQKRINAWKITSIGKIAPDFIQNDSTGNPVKLSDLRGKYVLIDFWASWCGPCRQENPHVVKAYHEFKNKGFTILGVSLDFNNDRDKWLKAIADDKLEWTQVTDLKGWENDAATLYGVRAIPGNFLLDKEGKIVAKNLRGADLEYTLEKYLN